MDTKIINAILEEVKVEIFSNESTVKKFQKIINILSRRLYVDVCSLYILNNQKKFELYATEGLSKEAVNKTFLDIDEGLIGEIGKARKTLMFTNIWNNENFSYKPETAEDPYFTLVGTPIFEENTLLGVLVLQNKANREHPKFQFHVIEIVASFLAKLIINSDFSINSKINKDFGEIILNVQFLNNEPACGKVIFHNKTFHHLLGKSVPNDIKILRSTVNSLLSTLDEKEKSKLELLNNNFNFTKKIIKYVENGLMPNLAISKVYNEIVFLTNEDFAITNYLRRFTDLLQVKSFNLMQLSIQNEMRVDDYILVAKEISNSRILLNYINAGVKGIVIEDITTSQNAIRIAKSLKIPVVTGLDNIVNILVNKKYIKLDPKTQCMIVFSDENEYIKNRAINYHKPENDYSDIAIGENSILNGSTFSFTINAYKDLEILENQTFFNKVCVLRQEVFFANLELLPSKKVQKMFFEHIFNKIGAKEISIKLFSFQNNIYYSAFNQYMYPKEEMNSINIMLKNPIILINQIEAIASAAKDKIIGILIPMISSVDDLIEFHRIIKSANKPNVKVIAMIEVPSIVEKIDDLLKYVDKIIINTDSLMKYFYAIDTNSSFARYHHLTTPFLTYIKKINDKCARLNKTCVVLGNMTGNAIGLIILNLLGFKNFSINSYVNLKEILSQVNAADIDKIRTKLEKCIAENVFDVRDFLLAN